MAALILIAGMFVKNKHTSNQAVVSFKRIETIDTISPSAEDILDKVLPDKKYYKVSSSTSSEAIAEETPARNPENTTEIDNGDDEFYDASKNHIDERYDISEFNFCSVNGRLDPLVSQVIDATQKLAAEQHKWKLYKSHRKLSQQQRDSIDNVVYDEKKCYAAILEEMWPLPDGTDTARVKRLVWQRYLTMFFRRYTQRQKHSGIPD